MKIIFCKDNQKPNQDGSKIIHFLNKCETKHDVKNIEHIPWYVFDI